MNDQYTRILEASHDFKERLSTRYFHYLCEFNGADSESIMRFISFCCQEEDKDMNEPRGPDGTSYRQRAAEENK